MIKNAIILTVLTLATLGCQTHQPPPPPMTSAWSDDAAIAMDMRHGWTIFTGPSRTLIGVNDQPSIERGKKLYTQHCQKCHGEKGRGDGSYAQAHGIKPANLAALSKILPNHYLVVQINNGRSDMPAWKDLLDAQQTWDLTNYIQTLGKK